MTKKPPEPLISFHVDFLLTRAELRYLRFYAAKRGLQTTSAQRALKSIALRGLHERMARDPQPSTFNPKP